METTDRLLAPAGYLFVLAHNAPADIAKRRLNVGLAVDREDLCRHVLVNSLTQFFVDRLRWPDREANLLVCFSRNLLLRYRQIDDRERYVHPAKCILALDAFPVQ